MFIFEIERLSGAHKRSLLDNLQRVYDDYIPNILLYKYEKT